MGRVLRPEDACQKRFSWFFNWIPKVHKCSFLPKTHKCNVNLVDLVEKFQTSIQSLLEKFGVDMAENEPLKVCQQLAES